MIHAARNVDIALRHARSLLAPGGILVLCEATAYLPWFDVTTGLIEGWQAFDDPWRTDQPLMSAGQWQRALMAAGFERAVSYPEPSSPAAVLGQNLILAQVAGAYRECMLEPAPEACVPSQDEAQSRDRVPGNSWRWPPTANGRRYCRPSYARRSRPCCASSIPSPSNRAES